MKRTMLSILLCCGLAATAQAQIIILENDPNKSRTEVTGELPFVPLLGVNYDQFAPLPDGVWLLCGLAGIYRLRKKKEALS